MTLTTGCMNPTLQTSLTIILAFAAKTEQDQTAQNLQYNPDLHYSLCFMHECGIIWILLKDRSCLLGLFDGKLNSLPHNPDF